MTKALFASGSSLVSVNNLIEDLFLASGLDFRSLNIDTFSDKEEQSHKSQILVLNKRNPEFSLQKALDAMITGGVIVMNADEKHFAGLKLTKPMRLITYGYNPKSTITASSIVVLDNISVQCCIQRQFSILNGDILEAQEFLVRTNYMELTEDDILSAVAVALLCGVKPDMISGK